MSAYLNVFLQLTDAVVRLGSFCRSNVLYQEFDNYDLWEKCRPFSLSAISDIMDEMAGKIECAQDSIKQYKVKQEWLKTATGDLDERLERVQEFDNYIREEEGNIEEYRLAIATLRSYRMIAIEQEFNDDKPNINKMLWFGIECEPPKIGEVYED